ncbi:hypothetical protein V8E51_001364 [Hyaloscypha variabilis]|jgi:hypothetical protein
MSGFNIPELSNPYNETSASSLHSLYLNGQLFRSIMMNASPLGMDLGEFLLEGDLEFLNQIASTQQAQVTNKVNGGIMGTGGSHQVDSRTPLLL